MRFPLHSVLSLAKNYIGELGLIGGIVNDLWIFEDFLVGNPNFLECAFKQEGDGQDKIGHLSLSQYEGIWHSQNVGDLLHISLHHTPIIAYNSPLVYHFRGQPRLLVSSCQNIFSWRSFHKVMQLVVA